jgi:IS4 transposase
MARDGSLFAALRRMTWALYGGGREGFINNAVRLNLSYHLLKEAPVAVKITVGKGCERAALREQIKAGDAYVGDRYYSEHYAFFTQLSRKGCRYLIRLVEKTVAVTVVEELPVTEEDGKAGVMRQAMVRLGTEKTLSEVLRVIWFTGQGGQLIMLATNLSADELSAADATLLYKCRWQVEFFFRWVKCLMGCGHWIAESPRGVAIQLYLALIGALLLQLDLGRRPSKRVWELMQWHQGGMIDEATATRLLQRQLAAEQRQREKAAAKKKG